MRMDPGVAWTVLILNLISCRGSTWPATGSVQPHSKWERCWSGGEIATRSPRNRFDECKLQVWTACHWKYAKIEVLKHMLTSSCRSGRTGVGEGTGGRWRTCRAKESARRWDRSESLLNMEPDRSAVKPGNHELCQRKFQLKKWNLTYYSLYDSKHEMTTVILSCL